MELIERKEKLENRLEEHGITEYKITHLNYLKVNHQAFANPYDVGSRMLILYALSYLTHNQEQRLEVKNWLEKENLWSHISPKEIQFFESTLQDGETLWSYSWEIESAYILAWSLKIIDEIPIKVEELDEFQIEEFQELVPFVGVKVHNFLSELELRDKEEILDENLLHELVTAFSRDLHIYGNEKTIVIDGEVSSRRHKALNWLRRFMDEDEWDETDTST